MKRSFKVSAVMASALSVLSETVNAEKEGNTFHPVLSFTPPLDDQDFNNWNLHESSIMLMNKIVVAPNGV